MQLMESIVQFVIQTAQKAESIFTKFITPNDTGITGGKQADFYIPKNHVHFFITSKELKVKILPSTFE